MKTRPCTGRDCGEQIIDATLVRKDGVRVRHVFDPQPVAGGKHEASVNLMGETEFRYNADAAEGWVSHFATCPNSPQFRGEA